MVQGGAISTRRDVTSYKLGGKTRLIFENGDITRIEADDRPRMVGHRIVPTRRQRRCRDYREMNGCRIPTRAVVS